MEGDSAGLGAAKKSLAPTTNAEIKSVQEQVWDEIRQRAVKASLAEGAGNDDVAKAREKKRVKVSATGGVSASSSGDSMWSMFEDSRKEPDPDSDSLEAQEARRVAHVENLVDEEIERFKDIHLPPGLMPTRNALVFWSGSAAL